MHVDWWAFDNKHVLIHVGKKKIKRKTEQIHGTLHVILAGSRPKLGVRLIHGYKAYGPILRDFEAKV